MASSNDAAQPNGQGSNGARSRVGSLPDVSIDIKTVERVADPMIGAVLLARGLKRGSARGAAMAVAGGGLLFRGISVNTSLVRTDGKAEAGAPAEAPELRRSITIGKPADELYRRWREPETLPRIMDGIADVVVIDNDHARWTVSAPLGKTLTWETRIVEDRPGEFVRWESVEGADLPSEGSVEFRPGPPDWGTEMTLHFRFDPPGGALGNTVMKLADAMPKATFVPNLLAGKVLRRFKSLVETGEIPKTELPLAARVVRD